MKFNQNGSKGQISLNFNKKVQFQRFLYQTLCVFIQIQDMKYIKRFFSSDAWVMSQGWDLGALDCTGGWGPNILFEHGCLAYQIDGDDE